MVYVIKKIKKKQANIIDQYFDKDYGIYFMLYFNFHIICVFQISLINDTKLSL